MISEGVVAVIGTYGSSVTEPAQLIYEDAGLLNIAYGATAESLTQRGYRYFFRTSFRDDRQGDYFAELVATKLNLRRVAIVHDNTTFARGLAEAARRSLARYPGVQVVFYDAITPGDRDFTAIISRLRAQNPDVVYFTAYYPEAGLFLRQMRDAGVQALFVGGNAAINAEFVEIAGLALAKGSLVTQEPMPTDLEYPEAQAFLAEYVARHGAPPPTGPTSSKPAHRPVGSRGRAAPEPASTASILGRPRVKAAKAVAPSIPRVSPGLFLWLILPVPTPACGSFFLCGSACLNDVSSCRRG